MENYELLWFCKSYSKERVWALLRRLSEISHLPWCVIVDFNDLLSVEDKLGWLDHPNYLMNGFQDAVQAAGLFNNSLEGYPRLLRMLVKVQLELMRKDLIGPWLIMTG